MSLFAGCPRCGREWATRDEYFDDRQVRFIGMRPSAEGGRGGDFLFSHEGPGCGATFVLQLEDFVDFCPPNLLVQNNDPARRRGAYCLHPVMLACPPTCMCGAMRLISERIAERLTHAT